MNYTISQVAYEQIRKMHPYFWQTYDCASVDDGVISYALASQYMKEEPTEYKSEEKMHYTFPKITHYTDKAGCFREFKSVASSQQIEKINDELIEMKQSRGLETIYECLNVIHACETWLRYFASEEAVDKAVYEVINKNMIRGYYGDEPTQETEEHMNITTDRKDIASIGEYIKHKKRVRKVIGYAIGDDGRDCYVSAAIDDDYGWRTHLTPIDEVTHKYIRVPVGGDAE